LTFITQHSLKFGRIKSWWLLVDDTKDVFISRKAYGDEYNLSFKSLENVVFGHFELIITKATGSN